MAEYAAKRSPNRCPTHPGELLRETVLPVRRSHQGRDRGRTRHLAHAPRQHPEGAGGRLADDSCEARQAVRQRPGPMDPDAGRLRQVEGSAQRQDRQHQTSQDAGASLALDSVKPSASKKPISGCPS